MIIPRPRFLLARFCKKTAARVIWIFSKSADNATGLVGYIYVWSGDDSPMQDAGPGKTISIPGRAPPWLVISHTLDNITLARWPGRLWRVEIVDPIKPWEMLSSPLRKDAVYTRAVSVRVLEERSVAELFGPRGHILSAIIDAAAALTEEQAHDLYKARHRRAGQIQTGIWRRWLAKREQFRNGVPGDADDIFSVAHPPRSHNSTGYNDFPDKLDGVLSVGLRNQSPIGRGLNVIENVVGDRAYKISGDASLMDDPDDPEGAYLIEPWAGASSVICDTMLAVGAAEFLSGSDREDLLSAWREVFAGDPL